MESTALICMVLFTSGLYCVLVRQLPAVVALRWWLYSLIVACLGLLLLRYSGGLSSSRISCTIAFLAIACVCAQVYLTGRGLLNLRNVRRKLIGATVVLGVVLYAGTGIWRVAENSGISPAIAVVGLGVASLVVAVHCSCARGTLVWAGALSVAGAGAVLRAFAELQLLPQGARELLFYLLPWNSQWWGCIAAATLALAVAYLALQQKEALEAASRDDCERMRMLLNSTDCGLCAVDSDGRVTFANPAAAVMLGTESGKVGGVPIEQILDARHESGSSQALSDFLLRPASPIPNAKALIRRSDGASVAAEWSVSPVVRGQQVDGAVLTLRDVTQREAAERFASLRGRVLEMIARNADVDEALSELAQGVELRLPGVACSILLCNGDSVQVIASARLPEELRSAMTQLPASQLRTAGERGGWEDKLRALAVKWSSTTWTEPMISSANEVMGIVVLNHPDPCRPSPMELSTLGEAARLGALAIERHRSFERLLHQGHHDALTGLPNRVLLADRLKQALARASRAHTQLALLCIDLDRFKCVNDTLGHECGDLFLQKISVCLAGRIRSADTLARTGGDEFTAILQDVKHQRDAQNVADALISSIRDPFDIEGHTLYGAASIGVAMYPQDGTDAETLQRNADRAMYRAKSQGSNTIQFYSSADAGENADRIDIEYHLHRAIEQGDFTLNYQPQYTCEGRLAAFEALLRFRHPKLGPVPPNRFIPVAEESGLIVPIGQWVLHETCRQIAAWQKEGMIPVRVAVNVSPLQFIRPEFSETVGRALETTGVKPQYLELELTEGVLMKAGEDSARQIDAVAQLGVRLSVDDFGTGYSSLSYLHQLPIQVLKIDRSFMGKMLEPGGTRSIVEAIISLAHRLGMQTVAEGVETADQLSLLQAAGCDLIQGFLFSQPLSAVDASRLLWQETVSRRGPGLDHRESAARKAGSTTCGRARSDFRPGPFVRKAG